MMRLRTEIGVAFAENQNDYVVGLGRIAFDAKAGESQAAANRPSVPLGRAKRKADHMAGCNKKYHSHEFEDVCSC